MQQTTQTKKKIKSAVNITIVALLTFVQVNAIYYFIGYADTKNWIIAFVSLLPLGMMNAYFAKEIKRRKNSAKEIIATLVVAVMFYIGIFLAYLNSFGASYLMAAVGYIALFFVAIYIIIGWLPKVQWTKKDKKASIIRFAIYFIIPAAA